MCEGSPKKVGGDVEANERGPITRVWGKNVDQSFPGAVKGKEKVSRSVDGFGLVGKEECRAGYMVFYARRYTVDYTH